MDEELKLLLALNVQATGQAVFADIARGLQGIVESSTAAKVALVPLAAGLGLVAAAGVAIGIAADQAVHFQTLITQIGNNTNASAAQVKFMNDAVLQLAQTTSTPIDQLANGLMHVMNMGYQGADAMNILTVANESAASTGSNTADVANILANVMHEFAIPTTDAAHAMDILHTAAALGNMTLEQMVGAFGPVAAIAATIGVPLDEAAAAMAAVTRHGFDAAEAGTQVKNMIERLAVPTAGAVKELEALSQATGVDLVTAQKQFAAGTLDLTGYLADLSKATNGNFQAFNQLMGGTQLTAAQLDALTQATHGNIDALQKLDPNIRGLYGLFILTGRGAQDYMSILKQVDDAQQGAGITAESYARTQATVGFQLDMLRNMLQVAAIELGQNFLPAITEVVQWLTGYGIPAFIQLATDIGQQLGPALQQVGQLFGSLASTLQSNGLLGALGILGQQIADFAVSMFQSGWNIVSTLASGMMQAAETVLQDVVNEIASFIASFLSGNSPPPEGPLSTIDQGGFNAILAYAQGMMQAMPSVQQTVTQIAGTIASTLASPDLTNAKASFDAIKASLDNVATSAAGAKQAIAGIQPAIDANKAAVADLNDAIQTVTTSYNDQIDPLQQQLDLLKSQVDYQTQIADAQDKVALAQIDQQLLQAQGDPVKRAQLQAELDKNKLLEQGYSLTSQIASIEAQKKQSAGDPAKLADLNLKEQDLQIQQQMLGLVDKTKVASLDAQKQQITNTDALRNANQAVVDAQQKAAELPLEQRIAQLKAAEQQQLQPLKDQLTTLQGQNQQLQAAQDRWKAIAGSVSAAGGGMKAPALGGAGTGLAAAGTSAADDVNTKMQKSVVSFVDQAKDAAKKWVAGFEQGVKDNLSKLETAFSALPKNLTTWLGNAWAGIDWGKIWNRAVNIAAGLGGALMATDWGAVGGKIGDGLGKALQIAIAGLQAGGKLVMQLSGLMSGLFNSIDWGKVGAAVLPKAVDFLFGVFNSLFDPNVWGEILGKHWLDILLLGLTIAFAPAKFIGPVAEILAKVPLVGPLMDWLLRALNDLGSPARKAIAQFIGDSFDVLGTAFHDTVFPAMDHELTGFGALIKDRLDTIGLKFLYFMEDIGKTIGDSGPKQVVAKMDEVLSALRTEIDQFAQEAVKRGETIITNLVTGIGNMDTAVRNAMVTIGTMMTAGALDGLSTFGQQIEDALTKAIDAININIGPFHLSANGFHVDAPQMPTISIPGFAGGTNSAPGGLALVGENGPELINLPRGASVTPIAGVGSVNGGGSGGGNVYITGNYLLSPSSLSELARQVGDVLTKQTGRAYTINRIQ